MFNNLKENLNMNLLFSQKIKLLEVIANKRENNKYL